MTEVLVQISVVCGSLTVIAAFFKVVSRWKWFRKFWYRNFSGPFSEWLQGAIQTGGAAAAQEFHSSTVEPILTDIRDDIKDIKSELTVNGGGSVKDAVAELTSKAKLVEEYMRASVMPGQWPPRASE